MMAASNDDDYKAWNHTTATLLTSSLHHAAEQVEYDTFTVQSAKLLFSFSLSLFLFYYSIFVTKDGQSENNQLYL